MRYVANHRGEWPHRQPSGWYADEEDVIEDFVAFDREYRHSAILLEERLKRMQDLFGRLAEKLGVDLLSLIEPGELKYEYSPDQSSDTD